MHSSTIPGDALFVAFDLETTGLSAGRDRIVEIGAVRFEASGRELGRFQGLVNPLCDMSPQARAVHGISDAELAAAPTADVVLPRFLAWLDESPGATMLAHNASLDAGFLGAELERIGASRDGLAIVDTLPLSRRLVDASNYRLDTLARRFDLDLEGSHRALADALRVKGLWLALSGLIGEPVPLVVYPVTAPSSMPPVPLGWETLSRAISMGCRARIAYDGGTHGTKPREITPLRFRHMGGVAYVVAQCHADEIEKAFRLDRVLHCEIV